MIAPADTLVSDTLVYDSASIALWKSNPDYDYNRELLTPELDLMGLFNAWLSKLLNKIFGSEFAEKYSEAILIGLVILILLLIIWFLYKKRPELFMRLKKSQMAYHVEEDTIYGIDFGKEIEAVLLRSDYREAVRLLYLQTLKQLSDAEQIDWQPFKTPTEYIYEIKQEEQRGYFRKLTNSFLRVRYGNFEASQALFEEMQSLQEIMMKGDRE